MPAREQWFIVRKVVLTHFKKEQARRLSERRPHMFEGLEGWNPKQHARLLSSVSPYDAAMLLKLWSGALTCAHKRSQVMGESEMCPCGAPSQTIHHLLCECVLVPPPPMDNKVQERTQTSTGSCSTCCHQVRTIMIYTYGGRAVLELCRFCQNPRNIPHVLRLMLISRDTC